METKRATPREQFGQPEAGQTVKKVFVGGLKENMEDEDLQQYFAQFGNVASVTRSVTAQNDHGCQRLGFVDFGFSTVCPILLR